MTQKDGYKGQVAINLEMGEEVFSSPQTHDPYDPAQYQFEKIIGKRLTTGHTGFKRLSARHKNVIALHLRCLSNRDIAFVTGLDDVHVGRILKDPLCQEIIGNYLDDMDNELLSLAPLAVDAVRSALGDGDAKVRLNAADKYFKATGKYARAEGGGETAEDVLARALARVASDNATALRQLTRTPPIRVIEGTTVDNDEEGIAP